MSNRHSRREFLELGSAGAVAAFAPSLLGASSMVRTAMSTAAAIDPDLIVINARVYTVDALLPRAEGFAVNAGR
ncbi:MAG: hypothetical protein ABI120_20700, partial [Gemmatimonadaceae bacterium]